MQRREQILERVAAAGELASPPPSEGGYMKEVLGCLRRADEDFRMIAGRTATVSIIDDQKREPAL